MRRHIYFVHEGKAAYPEIDAYKRFFASDYEVEDLFPDQLATKNDLAESVCWLMMGYYPAPILAKVVIHDYRSLSVGRLGLLKDRMKRWRNAKPSLRIFQNEAIRDAMGFTDGVPGLLLPMGVPESILSHRRAAGSGEPLCDFCYIGVMSSERRSEQMFESFLRRFGNRKTLYLYGEPEVAIRQAYDKHANIVFRGKMPQEQLFEEIVRAKAAVNYFPTHRPHLMQTPTKMLEYGALGLRILSNEQPQSRRTAQVYGIQSLWGPAHDIFRNVPDDISWPDNQSFDPSPLMWPVIIRQSGIADYLKKELGA
ncbi:MAG: glycosyltransferase family 1 protein [Proteobacteria bacterium]|nr:glycosyltransferase family 1 protein [Pseudomonadota bacterium]